MNSQEGIKHAEKKSTKKGAKFEDFVAPILSESSTFFNCNFERTSGTPGILGDKNSKKRRFCSNRKRYK